MQPKNDITIYRTKGDTDPLVFDLRVNTNGATVKVPSSANVSLKINIANTDIIVGESTTNGIFSFSANSLLTANVDLAKFEVHVSADYSYVIGTGSIYFKDRL